MVSYHTQTSVRDDEIAQLSFGISRDELILGEIDTSSEEPFMGLSPR